MPADLTGEAFVAFDPGLTIRKAIDRALRQHNVRVNIVMEFDNIETIKQAIIIAAGVSILPRHTVQKEASIRTLAAVEVGIPDLVRPVGIVHRRHRPLTPTAERFVQMLQDASDTSHEEPRTVSTRHANGEVWRGRNAPAHENGASAGSTRPREYVTRTRERGKQGD
jgi:hypothetical protein